MKLGVCAQALPRTSLIAALDTARDLGFEAVELPVDAASPWIDLDAALAGGWREIAAALRERGLVLSALSNHQEGQLLLGPHGEETAAIHRGSPDEQVAYALHRLRQTAELARRLEVDVVCGFTGCSNWTRFFPWPLRDGWERMEAPFRARMRPLLDDFSRLGVRFAHECHPLQFAYNTETAARAVELLEGHPAFCFNLDPANLLLAGVDPVLFAAEHGARVVHVHGKDGEVVAHHAARSGLLAHGPWHRPGRGFRFRVPGWGDVPWRRLISELQLAGFRGVIAVEHEDPTMSEREGLLQAIAHLRPLLLREPPPGERRWW
ncbi:MAG: sugar phosphate isomerase/epimerase [Planctomycetes bacterium]|nr:sugar phosphate isomerase/epimerase [Planctomycetota bacterium]